MKKDTGRKNPVTAMLFLAYAALMLYLLFIRNRTDMANMPYWEQVKSNYNLDFLRTIGNYWDVLTRPEYYVEKWGGYSVYRYHARAATVNLLGNIAMFVPFGAFLPALWPRFAKAWKALPLAAFSIVVIEIVQLLTLRGRCDVDDLFLNLTGITLGYFSWWLCRCCSHKWKKR